jgi:hypothetical protein
MNLSLLKPGESGKITKIGAIGPLKRRLMDMVCLWRGRQSGKGRAFGDP